MKIICIGDSLTVGYGVFRNECWVELVKNKLNIEIINKGVNGDTTAGILSRSYLDVVENHPTHVMIMGGCNDFMCGRSLNMVKNNIEELVKEALTYNIIPIIGIEPPIDPILSHRKWSGDVDYKLINKIEDCYRQWILEFCTNQNLLYVDFYYSFTENLKNKNPRELYVDGIHPTSLGHQLMCQCFIYAIESIL